jgi:oxalate decarboxylase/phosphoglucose isomerase-like protein (cupin superfamily)
VLRLRESIRDDKNMGDHLASGDAQSEWTSLTLPEEAKNLEQAREQAVQSRRSQTVWVTTARNEYQLFKNELAELGNIEVESSLSELKSDATEKSSDRLRIKVTILPPSSSGKPLPSEPPGR